MTTRARILAAALALVQKKQGPLSMGAIAEAAGLSRQALYLNFRDKADLFIGLLRYADGQRGLVKALAKIREAPNGVETLLAMVAPRARHNPGHKPLADAFELLRRQDPAAEQAWRSRLDDRLEGARSAVARLASEGRLKRGLDQAVAADLVWTLTSLGVWDNLVVHRGWSADEYRERVSALLLSAVVA